MPPPADLFLFGEGGHRGSYCSRCEKLLPDGMAWRVCGGALDNVLINYLCSYCANIAKAELAGIRRPAPPADEIRALRREVAELAELVLRLAERMKFASIVFDASVQAARLRAGETETTRGS